MFKDIACYHISFSTPRKKIKMKNIIQYSYLIPADSFSSFTSLGVAAQNSPKGFLNLQSTVVGVGVKEFAKRMDPIGIIFYLYANQWIISLQDL